MKKNKLSIYKITNPNSYFYKALESDELFDIFKYLSLGNVEIKRLKVKNNFSLIEIFNELIDKKNENFNSTVLLCVVEIFKPSNGTPIIYLSENAINFLVRNNMSLHFKVIVDTKLEIIFKNRLTIGSK